MRYHSLIESITTNGFEVGEMTKRNIKRLCSVEMDFGGEVRKYHGWITWWSMHRRDTAVVGGPRKYGSGFHSTEKKVYWDGWKKDVAEAMQARGFQRADCEVT